MTRAADFIRFGLPGFLLCFLVCPAPGQSATETLFPTLPSATDDIASDAPALSEAMSEKVSIWLEELGSKEFATRERAATRLTELGAAALPDLRRATRDTSDPEVQLRTEQIIKHLTQGDLETRIESFLAGEEVRFEGWRVAQSLLGDSIGIRELFVELMRSHPNVATSLEGTPRDRALAMNEAVTSIQNSMFIERKFPTRADAFALLLPSIDPNVPLDAAFDSILLAILRKEAASKIRRDAQLSGPFLSLLGRWIPRSTLANRDDVLLFGMSWDIEATLTLAMQTLTEATQAETLAFALQAIARFGEKEHIAIVLPMMDDTRPSSERGYARGELVHTQLGDVAMATIAVLQGIPLGDVGFKSAELHPVYGFILSDLGFPVDDEAPRKAAREKLEKLLVEDPEIRRLIAPDARLLMPKAQQAEGS